jgi:adenosylhomocysteine nucleosidase
MTVPTRPEPTPIGDLSVLFVMATEQEYGEHLRRRITPVITGVGPVEAAVGTSVALGELDRAGRLPDLVVSLGTAGSARLEHAGIYQVASIAYRDMDCSPLGFEPGVTPFTGLPAVIDIPDRLPDVPAASISTGGDIISGKAYDAIAADMVDMETYAVFRAAERLAIPVIGLRGISDGRSDLTGLHDWLEFLHVLDEKLALVIDAMDGHVRAGRFRPGRR